MSSYPMSSSPPIPHSTAEGSQPEVQLVAQLNTLLQALQLPIPIITPTDLTPSLLIAILESLLGERLPLPHVNQDKWLSKSQEKADKLQKVKIFLGVLEMDVLQMNVGLSEIDPRKLADGGWDEAIFVAELLCWIGRRVGLLETKVQPVIDEGQKKKRGTKQSRGHNKVNASFPSQEPFYTRPKTPHRERYPSPELDTDSVFYAPSTTGTTSTKQTQLTVSSFLDGEGGVLESVTSIGEDTKSLNNAVIHDHVIEVATPSSVALSFLPPFDDSGAYGSDLQDDYDQSHPPRCIHEVPSPSLLLSTDFDRSPPLHKSLVDQQHDAQVPQASPSGDSEGSNDLRGIDLDSNYPVKVPVRYTGFIEPVDEEFEISCFEQSQSLSTSFNQSFEKTSGRPNAEVLPDDSELRSQTIVSIHQEYERTLELLNERTRLLKELADLKGARSTP